MIVWFPLEVHVFSLYLASPFEYIIYAWLLISECNEEMNFREQVGQWAQCFAEKIWSSVHRHNLPLSGLGGYDPRSSEPSRDRSSNAMLPLVSPPWTPLFDGSAPIVVLVHSHIASYRDNAIHRAAAPYQPVL